MTWRRPWTCPHPTHGARVDPFSDSFLMWLPTCQLPMSEAAWGDTRILKPTMLLSVALIAALTSREPQQKPGAVQGFSLASR